MEERAKEKENKTSAGNPEKDRYGACISYRTDPTINLFQNIFVEVCAFLLYSAPIPYLSFEKSLLETHFVIICISPIVRHLQFCY